MKLLKTIIIKSKVVIHVWEADDGTIILGGIGWIEYFDYEHQKLLELEKEKKKNG